MMSMKIGQKIKIAREQKGLSQSELATALGITPQSVQQWEDAKSDMGPKRSRLGDVETALGLPPGSLTRDDYWRVEQDKPAYKIHNVSTSAPDHLQIPVIDYIQAGNWTDIQDLGASVDYIGTDMELSDKAFAVIIEGDSMKPDFTPGDKVIIDPQVQPVPGDYVIAKLAHEDKATFKKYRPRGKDKDGKEIIELVPLNEDHPSLTINASNPGYIIGTMVEHRRLRRRY